MNKRENGPKEGIPIIMLEYVYLLHHTVTRGEEENDKIIGIYSSEDVAKRAIERFKALPGFRDPDGEFTIGPYRLDQDYWADGFGPP
jgi:hypothetical protein